MKTAIVTAGLFLLSYVVINRGLGPNPLELVGTICVVLGFAGGVSWFMKKGRDGESRSHRSAEQELLEKINSASAESRSSPRPHRTRKLF